MTVQTKTSSQVNYEFTTMSLINYMIIFIGRCFIILNNLLQILVCTIYLCIYVHNFALETMQLIAIKTADYTKVKYFAV